MLITENTNEDGFIKEEQTFSDAAATAYLGTYFATCLALRDIIFRCCLSFTGGSSTVSSLDSTALGLLMYFIYTTECNSYHDVHSRDA